MKIAKTEAIKEAKDNYGHLSLTELVGTLHFGGTCIGHSCGTCPIHEPNSPFLCGYTSRSAGSDIRKKAVSYIFGYPDIEYGQLLEELENKVKEL